VDRLIERERNWYLGGGRRGVGRRRIKGTQIPPKITGQRAQRHGTSSTPEKSGRGGREGRWARVDWLVCFLDLGGIWLW
jgi:hypothetical protein